MSIDPVLVVFLERANGHRVGNTFPKYFRYRYNSNPKTLLEKALEENYLTKSDYKFNMYQTTNADLKDILRKHNLKVSGIKKELVERLLSNINEKELKSIFTTSHYKLTNTGEHIVDSNSHFIYCHKSKSLGEISLKKYATTFNKYPKLNKYEIALKLLNNNADKHRKNGKWGLYRNSLLSISRVYIDMENNKKGLEYLLKVCYIDLTGLENNNGYRPNLIMLAPGVIHRIEKVLSDIQDSDINLKKIYTRISDELSLPKERYSKNKSFKYLTSAINGDLDKINDKIKKENKDFSFEFLDDGLSKNIANISKNNTSKNKNSGNNNKNFFVSLIEKLFN